MSRFAAIPAVPTSNIPEWEYRLVGALVQNVDLLTGNLTDGTTSSKALLYSTYDFANVLPATIPVTLEQYPRKDMTGNNVLTSPSTYEAAVLYDANAQTYAETVRGCVYASDMQKMIGEIAVLRAVVNEIIQQLVN